MKGRLALCVVSFLCGALLSGCQVIVHPVVEMSSFFYEEADQYTAGGARLTGTVEAVEIHWISGSVLVEQGGAGAVTFQETANRDLDGDNSLQSWLDGTTLRIQYCRSGTWDLSGLQKDLVVQLPEGLTCQTLTVDSVSADVSAKAIASGKLEIDTVSGEIRAEECTVSEGVELDTTSGQISASLEGALGSLKGSTVSGQCTLAAGEVQAVDLGTTSGDLTVTLQGAPRSLEADTVSGSVTLSLPEDAGFTLSYDTVSGSFSSALPYTAEGTRCRFGGGSGTYHVDTTSGDLTIQAVQRTGGIGGPGANSRK